MWEIKNNEPVKIWRDDRRGFPVYKVSISSRNKQGKWINYYQEITFQRRDVEFENGEEIYINMAFPGAREWDTDDGKQKKEVWIVTDFSYPAAKKKQIPDISYDEAFTAVDDSVPF